MAILLTSLTSTQPPVPRRVREILMALAMMVVYNNASTVIKIDTTNKLPKSSTPTRTLTSQHHHLNPNHNEQLLSPLPPPRRQQRRRHSRCLLLSSQEQENNSSFHEPTTAIGFLEYLRAIDRAIRCHDSRARRQERQDKRGSRTSDGTGAGLEG
jgi:hypothetical protein